MLKRLWRPVIGLILLIAAWEAASRAGIWSEYVLPGPRKVFASAIKLISDGSLFRDAADSFRRVAFGYSIAFALAFWLGAASALAPAAEEYYRPFIEFLRNVPPLALISLLILWFGIGETSKIIIIVLASFFPMYLNIKKGFASVDAKFTDVGRSFGYGKAARFAYITLPASAPDIIVGMRVGLGYAWRAIIGAEMFAASTGLGHMIVYAQQMSRSDRVVTGIIAIGLVGLASDGVFRLLTNKIYAGRCDICANCAPEDLKRPIPIKKEG